MQYLGRQKGAAHRNIPDAPVIGANDGVSLSGNTALVLRIFRGAAPVGPFKKTCSYKDASATHLLRHCRRSGLLKVDLYFAAPALIDSLSETPA